MRPPSAATSAAFASSSKSVVGAAAAARSTRSTIVATHAASPTASSLSPSRRHFNTSTDSRLGFQDIRDRFRSIAGRKSAEKEASGDASTGAGAGAEAGNKNKQTKENDGRTFSERVREMATKAMYGDMGGLAERAKKQNLTPEEVRRFFAHQREQKAQSVLDSHGEQLLTGEESDNLESTARARRMIESMIAKSEARRMRKRWGSTDAADPQHKYQTHDFKISPRKLRFLSNQIGGQPIDHAILQMQFSAKRAAKRIKSTLALARDHAVAKGMDRSKMIVQQAFVGKGPVVSKRMVPRARGRGTIEKSFHSHMVVVLKHGKTPEEQRAEEMEKIKRRAMSVGTGGHFRTRAPANVSRPAAWAY